MKHSVKSYGLRNKVGKWQNTQKQLLTSSSLHLLERVHLYIVPFSSFERKTTKWLLLRIKASTSRARMKHLRSFTVISFENDFFVWKKKKIQIFNSKQFNSLAGFGTVHIINLKRLRILCGPQWLKAEEMPQSNYESKGNAGWRRNTAQHWEYTVLG